MEEDKGLLKRILGSFSRQEELDDLLIMSEHRNGFKREQAVRRLGSLGNPAAIPKLIFLLRLYQRLVSYDSSNAEILDSELVKWDIDFNRTSSQPTSAQEKQIKERYHQCRPLLSERTHRLLEFTVSVLKIDRQP
jgi:hypothetical protein